jgi:hypothetical protein
MATDRSTNRPATMPLENAEPCAALNDVPPLRSSRITARLESSATVIALPDGISNATPVYPPWPLAEGYFFIFSIVYN